MKFSLIDRSKAPEPKTKAGGTTSQFDKVVNSLVPGKAARIEPQGKETPRGIKVSISRAAKRNGKRVRSWDADGKVYAELVDEAPTERTAEDAVGPVTG